MFNRFMITAATAALIAGTSFTRRELARARRKVHQAVRACSRVRHRRVAPSTA